MAYFIDLDTASALTLQMETAHTTTAPACVACGTDTATNLPMVPSKVALTGATPVSIVAAPSSSYRSVTRIDVVNLDSVAHTFTLRMTGGTTTTIHQRTIAAGAAENLLDTARGAAGAAGAAGTILRSGSGAPDAGLGLDGDFYIDTTASAIYGPKATTWGSPTSLIGSAGAAGSVWSTGAGAPTGGANGDFYLRTSNYDVYQKSGGSWSVIGNILGTTGATGATGAVGGSWTALVKDDDFNDQPASTSTITMVTDQTATIKVGMGIRFKLSGTYYYARVKAIAADLLTIQGAPLTTGDGDLTELWWGLQKTFQVDIAISGTYGAATGNTLIQSIMRARKWWGGRAAFLVHFWGTHETADAGTQPQVNPRINTANVSTDNSAGGIELSTAGVQVANGDVAINPSNYSIVDGSRLELACTVAGGTGDAADLSITLIFCEE